VTEWGVKVACSSGFICQNLSSTCFLGLGLQTQQEEMLAVIALKNKSMNQE
jgi:hypothetical protein